MQKKIISILLLASIIASIGCSGEAAQSGDNTTASNTTSAAPADEYEFSTAYEGYEYRVLNADDIYSMHAKIDPGEANGETLNDAEYERCRTLEDKMGIKFVETNLGVDSKVAEEATKVVLANEDAYDVIYIPARNMYALSSEGYFNNLLDLDGLQLDKEWWLSSYNDPSIVNGQLWAAANYSQLMIIDSVWAIYYNETIGENLGLETPYQTVKDGKWTLDKMGTYMKAAASLNGDNTFTWDPEGNSIYGLACDHTIHLIRSCDELTIESENGKLIYTAGSSRYYDVISRIVNVLNESDGSVYYKRVSATDDQPGHYIYTFEHERSLMLTAEIAKTNRMRDKDYSFGVLPMPKYDEAQENYIGVPFYGTPCVSIPVTSPDPEKVAVITDALAYLSFKNVWGVFRNVTLEQKNLRNEESIEMLDIIINSIVPSLTTIYSVGSDLEVAVKDIMMTGSDAVSSTLASYESSIKTELEKINSK